MKVSVNTPCFICGASESGIVFTRKYPEFDYPGNFEIRRCQNCHLLYNSPRLIESEITKLYDNNYYFFTGKTALNSKE